MELTEIRARLKTIKEDLLVSAKEAPDRDPRAAADAFRAHAAEVGVLAEDIDKADTIRVLDTSAKDFDAGLHEDEAEPFLPFAIMRQ